MPVNNGHLRQRKITVTELLRLAPGARIDEGHKVQLLGSARTLDLHRDNGGIFLLNLAGGFETTLPPLTHADDVFRGTFIVHTAPTTAYTIVTAGSLNIIHGQVASSNVTGASDVSVAASADTVTFVASTAIIGDRVNVLGVQGRWYIEGFCDVVGGITTTQAS